MAKLDRVEVGILVRMLPFRYWRDLKSNKRHEGSTSTVGTSSYVEGSGNFRISQAQFASDQLKGTNDRLFEKVREKPKDSDATE